MLQEAMDEGDVKHDVSEACFDTRVNLLAKLPKVCQCILLKSPD